MDGSRNPLMTIMFSLAILIAAFSPSTGKTTSSEYYTQTWVAYAWSNGTEHTITIHGETHAALTAAARFAERTCGLPRLPLNSIVLQNTTKYWLVGTYPNSFYSHMKIASSCVSELTQ